MGQIKTIFAEGIYKANEARSFMRPGFCADKGRFLVPGHEAFGKKDILYLLFL